MSTSGQPTVAPVAPSAGRGRAEDAAAEGLLGEYGLPDSAPVEALRAVTRVAATVCGVPHAVVNLLGGCFQYQVGEVGFTGGTSGASDSMCAVAVRDERLRYVPDARREPAFAANPWVDGRLARVALYAAAPLVLPDGRVLGSLCIFSDQPGELSTAQRSALVDLAAQAVALFEQARAGREAARRAALTEAVLETIDVGIVACDADGHLTLFNRASRTFHGLAADASLSPAEWAGRYSLRDEAGAPIGRDQVPLFRALVDGEVHDAAMVIAPPDRPATTVRCDGQAMRDASGRLLGAVVAQKDVTDDRARTRELVAARDQAEAATRAKSAFIAAASHEIRTPLNGVLGMLEVLSSEGLSPRQAECVQVARRSGEALLTLLNDVLDLSKAEATSIELAARSFRPADVVADVAGALRAVAQRKGLQLAWTAPADGAVLLGDPARLRQVVVNLAGNAVKFTDSGRVDITVTTEQTAPGRRRLLVTVRDTGPGIDPAEADRLFDTFTQGAQGRRAGGTGLGLALSQQLVQRMGGSLSVASQPGAGSTFTVDVELPVATGGSLSPMPAEHMSAEHVPAEDMPTEGTAQPVSGPERRLRVLVADDNEINLVVARALLTAEGAEVETVDDGDSAVAAVQSAAVQQGPFDVVLLDLQMPRMSGLDAARAIRALPGELGRTRLVALTASTAENDRTACREAGMDRVLHKPVRRADLRAVLAGR